MMKKRGFGLRTICGILAGAIFSSSLISCGSDKKSSDDFKLSDGDYAWTLSSKDEKMLVSVWFYRGTLLYEVGYEGKTVVEKSSLGLKTSTVDFTEDLTFVDVEKNNNVAVSYSTITGKKSQVETSYNELVVSVSKSGLDFDVTVRAYEDGFAFRYDLSSPSESNKQVVIVEENSEFALPDQTMAYIQKADLKRDYFSYEESYETSMVESMSGIAASMPLLYKTQDGVWALVTESDLYGHDYIGSFLECDENGVLQTVSSYGAERQVQVSLPFTSPWRLASVGSLATVVESTLVEDVYGEVEYWKPENYDDLSQEEQVIYNYDWVTPGTSAWDWLYHHSDKVNEQADYYMHLEYLDYAIEHGLEWITLDAGWNDFNPDTIYLFKKLVKRAHENNVKVMVWGWAHKEMGDEATMIETLNFWDEIGVDGLKIDYFDGQKQDTANKVESQETLKITERLYQETAKRQMVLNCHGCNKPTGERRVYPHVINREGIRGNENMTNYKIEDMIALPFIRGSVGPSDYTPTIQPTLRMESTPASQLAMHILLETGGLTLGDEYATYQVSIAEDFIMNLPTRYDDVKFLEGDPSEYCVIMRRAGSDYYVAGITLHDKEFVLDLSFLEDGKQYQVEIYYDEIYVEEGDDGWGTVVPISNVTVKAQKDDMGLLRRTQKATKNTKLNISAMETGGFALKITEIK